jgi:epoxyqueuosine reductase
VLGLRYSSPPKGTPASPLHGQVASYAWGEDYHDVLAVRLQALGAWIEAQVGQAVPYRWYTDTGPLLERDLAQRAGLGWIGKNTCLIHPRLGSYFFLAEILLGIEVPPDAPFIYDRCGACTRCIQACPTSCILPDRTLDARRCLSYLTIELKGPIPPDLRPSMGNWVFGCDICQQVCPWNVRFSAVHGDQAFKPRPGLTRPDLAQELRLTAEGFKRRYKGNPLQRTKRRGYLRNVSTALGNSSDPEAIPALVEALQGDPEPLVRGHAAWALGRLRDEETGRMLEEALQIETDSYVLGEIEQALDMGWGLRKK